MPNTARVQFNEVNLTLTVGSLLKGVSAVQGITKRGPFRRTDILVKSWPEFIRIFGGEVAGNDFPTLCKRALEGGSQLRVNRIGHYTDLTDPTTLSALKATSEAYELVFDAAIVTNNVISITILGTVFNFDFTTGFTTSDDALATIATTLQDDAKIASAAVLPISGSTEDDRKIRILTEPGNEISSIVHSWTGGLSQGTISLATLDGVLNSTDEVLFKLRLKYEGDDYNNVYYVISDASNGDSGHFDITIYFEGESSLTETYRNLKIEAVAAADATYLQDIVLGSELVDVEYVNTSLLTGILRPVNLVYSFNGGSDGGSVVNADYIGDRAGGTGFYAFDTVDDCMVIACPDISDTDIHTAGVAYAESRKDMVYFGHLSNSLKTANALVAERATSLIDSSYGAFYAGGVKILDTTTSQIREISELGDVLGLSASVDVNQGEWWSFAQANRGQIKNALGVVNNFGAPGKFNDLNLLANRQINTVVVQNGRIMLSGNFTAQLVTSRTSFVSVRKLLITLKKNLRPILEQFLEEPNDVITWKAMYRAAKPYLDSLQSDEKRALHSYRWEGDQNVNSINDVVINKKSDIDQGIYKIKLFIKEIVSLQEIQVDIIQTPTSISFEDII